MKAKKDKIKKLVEEMLKNANEEMLKKIDTALNSSAIDIESWDEKINSMILPKIILIAIMENEVGQYKGIGTIFEKQVKANVRNLRCVI